MKKAHPGIDAKDGAQLVADQLAVAIAGEILSIVPGRVSVEVDARLSHDADATVSRVERLLHLMGERGVEKARRRALNGGQHCTVASSSLGLLALLARRVGCT